MKKRLVRFVPVLLLTLFALAQSGGNRISDESFELGCSTWLPWAGGGGKCISVTDAWDGTHVLRLTHSTKPADISGMYKRVPFNQTTAKPIRISVRLQVTNMQNDPADKYGGTLNCHVVYMNNLLDYCPTTLQLKNYGTSEWRWVGFNTADLTRFPHGNQPVKYIDFIPAKGQVIGTVDFDEARAEDYMPLTQGYVVPMMDDAYPEQYSLGYKTLKANTMACSIAAVTSFIGTSGYMTLAQLKEMYAGKCAVEDHSVQHLPMAGFTIAQLHNEFYNSKMWFTNNGIVAKSFILPRGSYNANVLGESQNCFVNHVSCFESVRTTDRGYNVAGEFPYTLKIQEVDATIDGKTTGRPLVIQDVDAWLDYSRQHRVILILLFHKIRDNCAGDVYCTSPAMFNSILASIKVRALKTITYDDAVKLMNGQSISSTTSTSTSTSVSSSSSSTSTSSSSCTVTTNGVTEPC